MVQNTLNDTLADWVFKIARAGILHYKTLEEGQRRVACIDISSLDSFCRQLDQPRTGLSNSAIISTAFIPTEG